MCRPQTHLMHMRSRMSAGPSFVQYMYTRARGVCAYCEGGEGEWGGFTWGGYEWTVDDDLDGVVCCVEAC